MKKLIFFFSIVLAYSCSTIETNEENATVLDKTIRIEISTKEANDAVQTSYYDYITDSYIIQQYIFN